MKRVLLIGVILVALGAAVVGGWYIFSHRAAAPEGHAAKPKPKPAPTPTYVDMALSRMSLRDKVASLLVMNQPGTDPTQLAAFMDTYKLGGFIMMGTNMPTSDAALRAETAALRGDDAKLPRLVATDEEGGVVKRLLGDTFASALTLKNEPVSATTQAFVDRSNMVQSVGITLNFGIIADVTADPNSFIYDRVLGTTPAAAADRVAAAVAASKNKTLSTLKHFPGHGETEDDSHHTIPSTPLSYNDWLQKDAVPFKAGVAAGANVVMVGHLQYAAIDSVPASLSKKWHDILRNTIGFKGVVITDAMGMLQDSGVPTYVNDPVGDAVAALQAGNTMLLYVTNPTASPNVLIDGIVAAVTNGKISQSVIDDDARLALELRQTSASLVR